MISPVSIRKHSTKKEGSNKIRGCKRVCLPIDQTIYEQVVDSKAAYRQLLDEYIIRYPELFPAKIGQGYNLHGSLPKSKKLPEVRLRRIQLKAKDEEGKLQVFTIAPCFVLPYMTGYTDEIEKVLFLYEKFGVPFWGLTYVFGRNDMYWYRLTQNLGRNSIIGTTIKDPNKLSEDLLADENIRNSMVKRLTLRSPLPWIVCWALQWPQWLMKNS